MVRQRDTRPVARHAEQTTTEVRRLPRVMPHPSRLRTEITPYRARERRGVPPLVARRQVERKHRRRDTDTVPQVSARASTAEQLAERREEIDAGVDAQR